MRGALQMAIEEARNHQGVSVNAIDPSSLKLSQPGLGDSTDAGKLRKTVEGATGIILATPEYHGSYSSVIKLVIENLGFPSVLSGKPVALLGIAAGSIGAIKALEHLRGVVSHVGGIVLPGSVSVAGVHNHFDEGGRVTDEKIEARIRSVATNLLDYINLNICPRKCLEEMVREATA